MKTTVILAVCLTYSAVSEAYTTVQQGSSQSQLPPGYYTVPTSVITSQECAPILQQLSLLQMKYLEEHQLLLNLELAKNQQHREVLTQITKTAQQGRAINPGLDTIQSDELVIEGTTETAVPDGIIPGLFSKAGNVAGDIVNTAGQLAKDDIDLKAALIGGVLGGAGNAASTALHKTGQVAAHAVSDIEDGFKNIFGSFGK